MDNNIVEKKSHLGLAILIIILCCAFGVGGFFGGKYYFEHYSKNDSKAVTEEKQAEEKQTEKEPTKEPTKEESKEITYEIIDQNDPRTDYNYKIQLSSDGKVLVKSDDIKNETVVASDIEKAKVMQYGMSDICMGNSVVMMVTKNHTLSYFSVDDIVCGGVTTVKVFDKVSGRTDIVDVVEKKTVEASEYEPPSYEIHAITKDGKEIDVTKELEANED